METLGAEHRLLARLDSVPGAQGGDIPELLHVVNTFLSSVENLELEFLGVDQSECSTTYSFTLDCANSPQVIHSIFNLVVKKIVFSCGVCLCFDKLKTASIVVCVTWSRWFSFMDILENNRERCMVDFIISLFY